jgi:hypothetical protein
MEDDSELVLERIKEDGTFDELRKKILELVKQDVRHYRLADTENCTTLPQLEIVPMNCSYLMQAQLNNFIEEAVLNSKALISSKADSRGRQEDVYNSVRREIE